MVTALLLSLAMAAGPVPAKEAPRTLQEQQVCAEIRDTNSRIPRRVCASEEQLALQAQLIDRPELFLDRSSVLLNKVN